MRRAFALGALLCTLVASASAQGIASNGSGLFKQDPSGRFPLIPEQQYIDTWYNFDGAVPGATSGLRVSQSTTSGVTLGTQPPFLTMTGNTTGQRCLVYEPGSFTTPVGDQQANFEFTVAFSLVPGDLGAGWFQFSYGDTTNFKVTRKPTACGIIVNGTGVAADTAFAPAGMMTAFVSDGSDSTYVPLMADNNALTKVVIHGDNQGAVYFYVNGVLKTTISSPSRNGTYPVFSFWQSGDDIETPFTVIGPIFIQRRWE